MRFSLNELDQQTMHTTTGDVTRPNPFTGQEPRPSRDQDAYRYVTAAALAQAVNEWTQARQVAAAQKEHLTARFSAESAARDKAEAAERDRQAAWDAEQTRRAGVVFPEGTAALRRALS